MNVILIALMAGLNRARGSKLFGYTNSTTIGRITSTLGMAVASQFMGYAIMESLIIWAGLFLWSIPGEGKYFSAFMGNYDGNEHEIKWIDELGDTLVSGIDERSNRLRGALCMCLRGSYMYPLFVAIGLLGHPMALLIGLSCLLQGVPYWFAKYPKDMGLNPVLYAELTWGACIGLMLMGAM